MKKITLAVSLMLILTACHLNTKHTVSVQDTLITIPTQSQRLKHLADIASRNIKVDKENTIIYFDKNGIVQNSPQIDGFYRKLLGYNREGKAVIQDFYQNSNTKQTNPMTLSNIKNLRNFDSAMMIGRVIWYSPKGEITQFLDYDKNGLVQRGGYYNQSGMRVLETEGDNHINVNAPVKMRGYYENGNILFENSQANDVSESTFYYQNGQKMWHGMSKSETIHAWKSDGTPTELSEIVDDVVAAEQRASKLINQFMNNE